MRLVTCQQPHDKQWSHRTRSLTPHTARGLSFTVSLVYIQTFLRMDNILPHNLYLLHSPIRPSTFHRLSICPSIRSSIYPTSIPPVHPSVHPPAHHSIRPSVLFQCENGITSHMYSAFVSHSATSLTTIFVCRLARFS